MELTKERSEWGGCLILTFGKDANLVPVAVNAAGGATLFVEEDSALAKAALRRGELDFVVNSVDEALRTLKNEIRQRRPLGVAVTGDLRAALEEITERGVKPDKIIHGLVANQGIADDLVRGLGSACTTLPVDADPDRPKMWHLQPKSLQELRQADRELLAVIAETDQTRRRWIERLPRYFRDSVDAGRWVSLSDDEVRALPAWISISPEARPTSPPTTP